MTHYCRRDPHRSLHEAADGCRRQSARRTGVQSASRFAVNPVVEHLHILGDSLHDAVAQLAIALLIVCVRILGEVYEVIRVHVGYLATIFFGPRRCVR